MKGLKVDMNSVSCALLVVVLILVIVCCFNKSNEEFSAFSFRCEKHCKTLEQCDNILCSSLCKEKCEKDDYINRCKAHAKHPNYYSTKEEDKIQYYAGGPKLNTKLGLEWSDYFKTCRYIQRRQKERGGIGRHTISHEELRKL